MSSMPEHEDHAAKVTRSREDQASSDSNDVSSSASAQPKASAVKRSNKRAYSFVIIFIVTVLALLVGYRYAASTTANDWYLLQVAKHTNIALGLIGERSTLEEGRPEGSAAQEIRAQRQAWREGRADATEAEI